MSEFDSDEEYKVIVHYRLSPILSYPQECKYFTKENAENFAIHAGAKHNVIRVEILLARQYGREV